MQLKNKVAIITGATSGIGKATAERFVAEGAKVVAIGLNDNDGQALMRDLTPQVDTQQAGGIFYIHADVSQTEEVQRAIKLTVERWGHIDILVNNAAIMTFKKLIDLDETDWDKVLGVNLKGPFLLAKYSIPHMAPGSAIVNISSVHAYATDPTVVPYATSKGGMEAFTRGLAVECEEQDIRVNAIRPGSVNTRMLWENPNVKSGEEHIDPLELGRPEELAAAILFLASDQASFISGEIMNVDGGRLAHLGGHHAAGGGLTARPKDSETRPEERQPAA